MNHDDFHRYLRQLAQSRFMQASETIEDAIEMRVQDSLLCLEWNADEQRLELTLPLPEFIGADDSEALQLRLCRALLAWQWVEAAQPHHLRFGELGPSGQIVGMASIRADQIHSAAALETAVLQAHGELQQAWLQLGAQLLAEAVEQAQPLPDIDGPGDA